MAAGSEGRIGNCMAGEEEARKQIDKDWSKTLSAKRRQCIGTVIGLLINGTSTGSESFMAPFARA